MIRYLQKLDAKKRILDKCTKAFVVEVVLLLCLGAVAKYFSWKIEESLGVVATVVLLLNSVVIGGLALLLSDVGTWLHNEIYQFKLSNNIR